MAQAQGMGLKSTLGFYTALGAAGPDLCQAEQPALPKELWCMRSYFDYDLEQKTEKMVTFKQRWL